MLKLFLVLLTEIQYKMKLKIMSSTDDKMLQEILNRALNFEVPCGDSGVGLVPCKLHVILV